jgi:hypothetical protein
MIGRDFKHPRIELLRLAQFALAVQRNRFAEDLIEIE